jgi:hypothetical protein
MKVCILSYKRPDTVLTGKYLDFATLVVPESQKTEYQKYNKNEILTCPDTVDGNVSRKRNWILDQFKDEDLVTMDDDINQIGYNQSGTGSFALTAQKFWNFCLIAFNMAREIGTPLWGLNQNFDPLNYKAYSPFSLTSPVLGPTLGFCAGIDTRFDENIPLKEDYDFSLQVLLKYRKILRFNKYHYVSKHLTNKGGLIGYRSMDKELEQATLLQKKWGSKIVQIERKTAYGTATVNPKIQIPI